MKTNTQKIIKCKDSSRVSVKSIAHIEIEIISNVFNKIIIEMPKPGDHLEIHSLKFNSNELFYRC